MQAVIMAGGKGTRLASITKDEIPKPMVPINGKPLLLWQVEELKLYGITDIIMVIGHLGEKIKDYFGNGSQLGIHISYIVETTPLGTAGAFYYLREQLKDKYFLLIFGDVYFSIDINKMEQFHISKKSEATLFVHPNSHPVDSDLVILDSDSRVLRFDSKNNNRDYWYDNCVNAGFYILNRSICEKVTTPAKADLEKDILMPLVCDNNAIYGYRSPEYIKDIGTVDRIQQTERDIKNNFIQNKCLSHKQKCIFLDRDGTINVHKGLLFKHEDFELETGVIEAIRLLNQNGWLAIVVTNQPSVARGLCEIEDINDIHRKMATLLGREGVFLDGVYFCPHHPDKGYPEENPLYKKSCHCRKPDIGMIMEAAKTDNIDLSVSWMIGDTTTDIQTGINAGLHTALVLTGEAGSDCKYDVSPDLVCPDLLTAVKTILEKE